MRPNTIETVMARVEPVTEAGCWIWMGPTVSGYGVVQWQGWKDGRQSKFCVECYRKSQREHRRAYRAARKAS